MFQRIRGVQPRTAGYLRRTCLIHVLPLRSSLPNRLEVVGILDTFSHRHTIMLLVLVMLFGASHAALPQYIVPCKDGAKLVECTIKNGNSAIPKLHPGDPKFKIPTLDPLTITKLDVKDSSSRNVALNLTFTNLKLYGLKDSKLVGAIMNTKAKHVEWTLDIPTITIKSMYKAQGKFLVLPIRGEGPCEIGLDKPRIVFKIDYKTFTSKGMEFAQLTKTELKYTVERMHFRFEKLFNGDKTLGDNVNLALNENWKEFNMQMGPPIAEGINLVLRQVIANIIKGVPFKDIIKP